MGISSSKIKELVKINLISPFFLEFNQVNQNQMSGYIYRYYKPNSEKRLDHSFNNTIIVVKINDTTSQIMPEKFVELHTKIDSFKQVSTKDGKRYEIKEDFDNGKLIIRLDLTNIIKEIVYISQQT